MNKLKYIFPALALIAGCMNTEIETTDCSRTVTVHADFPSTKVSLEQGPSLDIVTKWHEGDEVKILLVNDGKTYVLPTSRVRDITEDGKGCIFSYDLPEDFGNTMDGYGIVCFTVEPGSDNLSKPELLTSDDVSYPFPLWRGPIAECHPCAYYEGLVEGSDLFFNFEFFQTFEILHVTNKTDKQITFTQNGFEVSPVWWRTTCWRRMIHNAVEAGDGTSIHPDIRKVNIPSMGTGIVISSYIPLDKATISSATLVADIDGKVIKSENKKTSEVSLKPGHAYHLYASWDGSKLKFEKGSMDMFTVSPLTLDFGQVNVGDSKMLSFDITNIDRSQICIDEIWTDDTNFSVDWLAGTVAPDETRTIHVTFTPDREYIANGKFTVGNSSSSYDVTYTAQGVNTSSASGEYVDLGLPSGLKWASCNLGASKPEGYGGYYQWAGLQDVTDTNIYLNVSNCPYHTGSSYFTGWTKYIPSNESSYWSGSGSPDNKTVLDPEDDVAHETLGGKWRIPTKAEFQELIDNCTSEWTTMNGVKGRKFTSKKNGNSIFLPAAGYRINGGVYFAGSCGNYWSSSLDTDGPSSACSMSFDSGSVYTRRDYRFHGVSVRPVYDEGISGQAVISVSPEAIEFGTVSLGESATGSFTISNTGTATASVSITNPSDVVTSDVSGDITIGVGASKTVTLTFTPKEKGSYGGRILVSCGGTDINVLYEGTCIEKNNDAPEAVDLGLPSGLKWASCNLGASKPEGYGRYYQWGGLQDVTDTSIYLDWNNCPFHTSGGEYDWTKYVPSNKASYWSGAGSPDNKTVIDPEDDIAHVKLGGKWRMPTVEEFEELLNNCTFEWTTLNGIYGRKFTSKNNGNSIFLPATGVRYYRYLDFVGSVGHYWSSSLETFYPYSAYELNLGGGGVIINGSYRYYGHSVRPVSE